MSTISKTFENLFEIFEDLFEDLFERRVNREEYFNASDKIISFLEEGDESQNRKRIYYEKNNKYTDLNGMMNVYGKFIRAEKEREIFYGGYFYFKHDASTILPPLGFWLDCLKNVYFIDVTEIKKNHLVESWRGDGTGTQRILNVDYYKNEKHLLAEFPTVDDVPGIFEVKPDPIYGDGVVKHILQVDVSGIEKNLFVEVLGAEDAKRILEASIFDMK